MINGEEILNQQIKRYFSVTYNHQLTQEEIGSLAHLLSSRGVTPELISSAVSDEGGPHTKPDDNFVPEKIFQLWYILHPITVSFKKNHLLQIFCKGILYPHLLTISENNATALSIVFQERSNAKLNYTQLLYSSFLGHAEFEIARSFNEKDPQLADRYYRNCIKHLMAGRGLSQIKSRYNYGMVGVSYYYIAQSLAGAEKQHHLSLSIENLDSAEQLGDETTDHFKFLGDALLEHASESNDLSEYLRALEKLQRGYSQDSQNTNIIASLARCHLYIGIAKTHHGDNSGIVHLRESIRLYDLLETTEASKRFPDAMIWGRRGQARLQLWYQGERGLDLLNRAIEDLQVVCETSSLWRHALANALFEHYRLFKDSEHVSDLQKAKALNDQNHIADNIDEDHLKQRGRIYLEWAKTFTNKEAYDIALESFQNCLPCEDPEIQYYILVVLANRGIQFSYEDDLREAIKGLETLPDLSELGESKIGLLPKVYRELAIKVHQKQPEEALSLLNKAIAILQEKFSSTEPQSKEERAEYCGMLGGNYHDRYKLSDLPEDIYHAREHLQQAYDFGITNSTFFGRFGHVCLQCGNITEDIEEQRGFFEDAVKYLELSKSGGNEDASNYSELGEAYFRLYQIRKDHGTLKKALIMFEESLNKGNDSPHNLGLIGDCYYHLSRFKNPIENLSKALDFKAKARLAGHESKEHFSLVGRINLLLYEKLGHQDHFLNGIKFICKAGHKDKAWPWPVCQLAEVTERFSEILQQLKAEGQIEESFFYPDDRIWRFFLENQSEKLWFEGAKLAASWPEVKEKILGGKSKVYIAEDPHGLISSTYVFKPGDPYQKLPNGGLQRLHEEQERTIKMNQYLEQIGAEKFLVPTPIGIFPLDKTKLYAMRRATGQNLSDLILYGSHRYCEEAIQNTIEFLALYHAWSAVSQENREQAVKESKSRLNRLKRAIRDVGLSTSLADKIINLIEPLFEIIRQLPLVEKKDAHPDNWIVTNKGEIVMIDLEKPKPQSEFILFELVQLVEDLPYLLWNGEGWQRRKALIKKYLGHYNKFLEVRSIPRFSISPELQVATYLSFTILYALWGLGFAFTKGQKQWISSSSKLQWENRMKHYFDLVSVVPPIWAEENLPFSAPNWERLLTLVGEIRKSLSTFRTDL